MERLERAAALRVSPPSPPRAAADIDKRGLLVSAIKHRPTLARRAGSCSKARDQGQGFRDSAAMYCHATNQASDTASSAGVESTPVQLPVSTSGLPGERLRMS